MNGARKCGVSVVALAAVVLAPGRYAGAVESGERPEAEMFSPQATVQEPSELQAELQWHRARDVVRRIDAGSGLVSFTSGSTPMRLLFNPAAVEDLAVGQSIVVKTALAKIPPGPDVRAYDAPERPRAVPGEEELGYRRITGLVRDVDAQRGRVEVRAHGELLNLQLPAEAIEGVKVGDMVTLHMAFDKSLSPVPGQGIGHPENRRSE